MPVKNGSHIRTGLACTRDFCGGPHPRALLFVLKKRRGNDSIRNLRPLRSEESKQQQPSLGCQSPGKLRFKSGAETAQKIFFFT